jgi:hypothetical protein
MLVSSFSAGRLKCSFHDYVMLYFLTNAEPYDTLRAVPKRIAKIGSFFLFTNQYITFVLTQS